MKISIRETGSEEDIPSKYVVTISYDSSDVNYAGNMEWRLIIRSIRPFCHLSNGTPFS
jgi:hypothetical protein